MNAPRHTPGEPHTPVESRFFTQVVGHGTLVAVVALIVALIGAVAVFRIPIQMIPDLDVRTISVETRWPGATPQDIEQEILIEQERYLRSVPNLTRMLASADSGSAEIELEFPYNVDITESLIQVNNALSQVPAYPQNVDEPRVLASSFSANAFMFFRVSPMPGNPRELDLVLMRDFLDDNVRPRMESISGVSEVRITGGAERQIQLWFEPAKLAALGLTIGDVRTAMNARNRDVSGGELVEGKRRYLLRTVGRVESLDELKALIISRQGDSLVRLGDIAQIVQDHYEVQQVARLNGNVVLGLSVRRESGSNVIEIKEAMIDEMGRLNREVLEPAGLTLTLLTDDARYVEASIENVRNNLLLGALFATLVMYGFLRSKRATLVAVIGIPLCAIAAFLGLLLAGRTLNVISLAGVAFAIGMTVDNTIVVLENIEHHRRRGLDRLRSAIIGVQEVWPAVLASTLTTMLVFLPILFIEQEAGQLYSDVAIAISSAILASMLIAVTVVPAFSARLDFSVRTQAGSPKTCRWCRVVLKVTDALIVTSRRRIGVMVATLALAVVVVLTLTPPAEYLPEGEEPKTFATMFAPPGYNLGAMLEIAEQVEAVVNPHIDADRAAFAAGETPFPPLRYANMQVEARSLRIIAEPADAADIEALMDALTALYEGYPGMRAFAARGSIISSNDGGTRSINLDIAGSDLEALFAVARRANARAEALFDNPRIQTQPTSLGLTQPLIEVRPRWDRAAELGVTAQELGFTVAAFTSGAFLDEFYLDDDKIDIYAYGPGGPGARLAGLGDIPVRTAQGATLPLSGVAELREIVDVANVRRVDGQRTVTLNIIPPRSVALETGVETVRNDLVGAMRSAGEIPRDVNVRISGASDQLDATRAALAGNFLVAVAIVYLLLVAIFVHWGYPLLIMASIPLGLAAGLVGLALLNLIGALLPALGMAPIRQPFDMISMLGFLILLGTVVNNPILIVDKALDFFRDPANDAHTAVRLAVEARLRPIAMTTLTTLIGLMPLVFLPGEGTELYRGVGVIVLAGLLGAAIVTLVFLPALVVTVLNRVARPQPTQGAPA